MTFAFYILGRQLFAIHMAADEPVTLYASEDEE